MPVKTIIYSKNKGIIYWEHNINNLLNAQFLEGRRKWLKEGGMSFVPTGHNIQILRKNVSDLEIIDERETARALIENRQPYEYKTEPYDYQKAAIKKIGKTDGFALFMVPGTGKSKVAIDWAGILYSAGFINRVLIVAPKGVHSQWIDEQIREHYGMGYTAAEFPWEVDDPAEDVISFGAINYEALNNKENMEALRQWITGNPGETLLILDESHYVKNVKTKRWKNCSALRELSMHCLLLTGTPIAKNLIDEWAQLKLLDENILGCRYKATFRNTYCIMGGHKNMMIVGYHNQDKFDEKVAPYVFRINKDAIEGLEAQNFSRYRFPMTDRQKELYIELASQMVVEIDEGAVTTENAITKAIRLQTISNGFVMLDEEDEVRDLFPKVVDNPRIQALYSVIEPLCYSEVPFIVWCRFHKDIENVYNALVLKKIKPALYYGAISAGDRREHLKEFLGGNRQVLVGTPATGGVGLNLQVSGCRDAVYYSNSENSINRWQSEDRIHRIGTKGIVTYTDLIATGSRDSAILLNLRKKKDLSDMTLDRIRDELIVAMAKC